MDSDPIRQIQGLLDDPGRMLEKISRIRSALDAMSSALPQAAPAAGSPPQGATQPRLPADDPVYGRLLQALREMQTQIDERVKPLATEIVRHEVARLRAQSDDHQNSLKECLARIDQSIVNCFARMEAYRLGSAELEALNHRLAELGAAPEPPPPALAEGSAADSIIARLESLRLAGKI
jgi:hypothetical protein